MPICGFDSLPLVAITEICCKISDFYRDFFSVSLCEPAQEYAALPQSICPMVRSTAIFVADKCMV
jgi:hypothetical protein